MSSPIGEDVPSNRRLSPGGDFLGGRKLCFIPALHVDQSKFGHPMRLQLLCAIFLLVNCQDFGCLSFHETIMYFTNTSDGNITVTFYGWKRGGYVGLSFQNTKDFTTLPTLMVISNVTESLWRVSNHLTNDSLPIRGEVDQSVGLSIDDRYHFKFTVPYVMISKCQYIAIARGYTAYGSMHQEYDFRPSPIVFPNVSLEIGWCDPLLLKHTGRIMSDFVWLFVPATIFYFGCFLTAVYLRDIPTLKSRGLGPMLAPLGIWGNLLFGFLAQVYYTYEEQYNVGCFMTVFGEYLSGLSAIGIPMFVRFRYFALINVNYHRERMMQSSKISEDQRLPWQARFLNRFTSPALLILGDLILVLIFLIIGVIAFSAYHWQCGTPASPIMRYVILIYTAIICLLCLAFQSYDAFNNRKLILACQWRKFFIDTDHYYHRLEVMATPFALVFIVLWVALDVPTIFREIFFFVAYWICGGFALLVAVIIHLKNQCRPKRKDGSKNELETVLNDKVLHDMFSDFCKHEFSLENLYFKMAIMEYKVSIEDERSKLVKGIITRFMTPSSPFEVNLPGQILQKFYGLGERMIFSADLFAECELEVTRNLHDTFARFQFSGEYLAHKSKMLSLGVKIV
jgi:hypothetical protein